MEASATRIQDVSTYMLSKFKKEMLKVKPEVFRSKVNESLERKQKQKQDDAVALAVAKAKPVPAPKAGLFGLGTRVL